MTPTRGGTTAGRLLRLLLGVLRLRLPVLLLLALLLLVAAEAAVPAAWCTTAVWRRLHHVLREGHWPPWVHHHWGDRRVGPLGPSLLVMCRAEVTPRTTLRSPNAWRRPLQLHHPTSTARRSARLLRLLLPLIPLPTTVLLPVLLLVHDWGSGPSSHLVVRHHVARVGVCPHRGWWRPSVVHVPPRWWVWLHHGWWPPLHHVGAWPMSLPMAGCALVAVRGGVVTLTLLVLVAAHTTPIPAATHMQPHHQHLTSQLHCNKASSTRTPLTKAC